MRALIRFEVLWLEADRIRSVVWIWCRGKNWENNSSNINTLKDNMNNSELTSWQYSNTGIKSLLRRFQAPGRPNARSIHIDIDLWEDKTTRYQQESSILSTQKLMPPSNQKSISYTYGGYRCSRLAKSFAKRHPTERSILKYNQKETSFIFGSSRMIAAR